MIRKLKKLRQEMRRRMHQRLRDQHRWLAAVLRGHYAYFGIPGNSTCLGRFRLHVMKAWGAGPATASRSYLRLSAPDHSTQLS
jgi:RNA-directed DNA polymerase